MSALQFDWDDSGKSASLLDGYGVIGWVRRGAIGFRGYAAASDAAQSALLVYTCALEQLRRVGVDIGYGLTARSLTTSREGGRDWIRVGGRVVALMLPPSAVPGPGMASYGFELLVPCFLPMSVVADVAREAYATLQRAGAVRYVDMGWAAECAEFASTAGVHEHTESTLIGELT